MIKSLGIMKLFWEVPFCLLSFLFHRILRMLLIGLVYIRAKKVTKRHDMREWIGISEMLKFPLALPYIMVTGPRWNCHAIIGILRPLQVQSNLSINLEHCQRSAAQWTVVLYNLKRETVCHIGSTTDVDNTEWRKIELEAGFYSIALRYYNCMDKPVFPAVTIDGNPSIPERPAVREYDRYAHFLETIRDYNGVFYLFLHYYVFKLVCWRKWLPKTFVRKELLPVGNPETEFLYGSLRKEQPLAITLESDLLLTSTVYISLYNKCSFPVFWERIEHTEYSRSHAPCDGYYVIRIIKK